MATKYTLAVLKAWEELILAKKYEIWENLEMEDEIRLRFNLEEYDVYSEFFTVMAKFINPRIFAKVLVSDIAKEARFPEFCDLPRPTYINHLDCSSYKEAPQGLVESYSLHPQVWIDAFVKVRNPTEYPVCVFYPVFEGETAPWYEIGKVIDFDRVSAKLIEMKIPDDDKRWENFLGEIPDQDLELLEEDEETEEENEDDYNALRTNFHQRISYYLESPLRIFTSSEKVFREPENPKFKAPHRVKIIELQSGVRSSINYWTLGLGCDFPIIEALFYTGAFDKVTT